MATDLQELPSFDRPPVVETVIGAQFAPIADFSAAHYGWFWKQYLDASWTKAQDAPRVLKQSEKFGDQFVWSMPAPPVVVQNAGEPDRIIFVNSDDERVIQIQSNKFYYNWRKRQGAYPSFVETYPEFRRCLGAFEGFLRDAKLEGISLNQWELTYINHVPKGTLWNSPSDWSSVFPGLFGRIGSPTAGTCLESLSGMWRFEIPPRRGRLYVSAQHAKIEDGQEVLQVNLTGRGPVVSDDEEWDLSSGMTIGHDVLVRTFRDLASPAALAHWGSR